MSKKTKLEIVIDEMGLKQVWIAEKTGIHYTEVSRIVSGRTNPSPEEKAAFAEVLGKPENELF